MANGTVIHGEDAGTGGSGVGYIGVFDNYTALITAYPTAPTLSLAYVQNSQGTPWLPGSLLGTFYSKGTYLFDGINWVDGLDEVSEELQNILDTMNSQTLAEVLIEGNYTNDGQVIKALNGLGLLNLRDSGVDGQVLLQGEETTIKMFPTGGVDMNAGTFLTTSHYSNMFMGLNGAGMFLVKSDFTKFGGFGTNENDLLPTGTAAFANYPVYGAAQNINFLPSIVNSFASGLDFVVKTNNAIYGNRRAYSKNNEQWELIVDHVSPATVDRLQTHQDEDGIIALTKNIAISQSYIIQSIITAPTITSNQDNYSPAGFDDDTDLIRVDVDANNRSISGIPAPPLGVFRILGIKNINTASLDLRFEHNNAASLPENRFLCRDNNNKSIKPNEMALWFYDHNVERWTPFNRIG